MARSLLNSTASTFVCWFRPAPDQPWRRVAVANSDQEALSALLDNTSPADRLGADLMILESAASPADVLASIAAGPAVPPYQPPIRAARRRARQLGRRAAAENANPAQDLYHTPPPSPGGSPCA